MPCKFNMIFYGIFEDFRHWKHCRRGKHQATREDGVPPCLVGPWWLPSTYDSTHTLHLLPKKSPSSSSMSSSSFCCDFDLLAQSSTHKTALGDYSSVCDSSNGPISFCSSALFIANFCCIGDPVLELACQIMRSQVILMHDIGSRNL